MVLLLFSFCFDFLRQVMQPFGNHNVIVWFLIPAFLLAFFVKIALPADPVLAFDPRDVITALILLRARLAAAIRVFQV